MTFCSLLLHVVGACLYLLIGICVAEGAQDTTPQNESERLLDEAIKLRNERKFSEAYDKATKSWECAPPNLKDSQDGLLGLAIIQNVLGDLALQGGMSEEAVEHQRESLNLKRTAFPAIATEGFKGYPVGNQQLVIAHRNLGRALFQVGNYREAADEYRAARTIAQNPGSESAEWLVPNCSLFLSDALLKLGDSQGAHVEANDALDQLQRDFSRSKDPNVRDAIPAALQRVSIALLELGEFESAQEKTFEAYQIVCDLHRLPLESLSNDGLMGRIQATNDLANICRQLRMFPEARDRAFESIEYARRLYGDQNPNLAVLHDNCAMILLELAEYDLASKSINAAEEILISSPAPSGILASHALAKARICTMRGDSAGARYNERLAVDAFRNSGVDGVDLLLALDRLTTTSVVLGELDEAEAATIESLSIARKLFPRTRYKNGHPHLLTALVHNAAVLLRQGRAAEANGVLIEAQEIQEQLYPKDLYPQGGEITPQLFATMAAYCSETGNRIEEMKWLLEEQHVRTAEANLILSGLSNAEAVNFTLFGDLRMPGRLLAAVESTESRSADEKDLKDVYDVVLERRGLVHRFMQLRARLIRQTTPEDRILFELIHKRQVLHRQRRSPLAADPNEQRKIIRATLDAVTALEQEVAKHLSQQLKEIALEKSTTARLQSNLPPDTVLVEFVRYKAHRMDAANSQEMYGAFVVNQHRIQFITIGDAVQIDAVIADAFNAAASPGSKPDQLTRVREQVFDKLADRFPKGTIHLAFCPDGATSMIPWSALTDASGSALIHSFTITMIPHADSIVRSQYLPLNTAESSSIAGKVLFVGGLEFGEPGIPYSNIEFTAYNPTLFGSKPDSELVHLDGPATVVTGTAVLDALQSSAVAHLATHGFANDSQQPTVALADRRARSANADVILMDSDLLLRNPYLGVGIALSNANCPTCDDTFLTGEDISGISLPNLKLAFLACCYSGSGKEVPGEGVFGLNRAFHAAGTTTVISAMWRADDLAAQFITERFYTYLRTGLGPAEALRQAQLAVANGELSEDARHPYFWAGWSVSGDSGPLPTQLAVIEPAKNADTDFKMQKTSSRGFRSTVLICTAIIGAYATWRFFRRRRRAKTTLAG